MLFSFKHSLIKILGAFYLRITSWGFRQRNFLTITWWITIRDVGIILCSDVKNFSHSESLLINFHSGNANAILIQAFINENTRSIVSSDNQLRISSEELFLNYLKNYNSENRDSHAVRSRKVYSFSDLYRFPQWKILILRSCKNSLIKNTQALYL